MPVKGKLYLIPTTLGDNEPLEVLPLFVKKVVEELNHFIVENEKTARRFIKKIDGKKPQSRLKFYLLDKFTRDEDTRNYLDTCLNGTDMGLLSEAGVPAIADPGANIVLQAHRKGIRVVRLVGPSSVTMAMMSSGLNGQNFAFNGYLPIDKSERKAALKELEKRSKQLNQSQLFIETPYRNEALFSDMMRLLTPDTLLCIATDISLKTEEIRTMSIKEWKHVNPDLKKRPTIYIIHKF